MYYRHNLDIIYPENCDEHMITVKRVRSLKFDTDYSYLDKRLRFKFMRGIYWMLLNLIVFPVMRFSHGLRIYGRKNFNRHKRNSKTVRLPYPTTFSIGIILPCLKQCVHISLIFLRGRITLKVLAAN